MKDLTILMVMTLIGYIGGIVTQIAIKMPFIIELYTLVALFASTPFITSKVIRNALLVLIIPSIMTFMKMLVDPGFEKEFFVGASIIMMPALFIV